MQNCIVLLRQPCMNQKRFVRLFAKVDHWRYEQDMSLNIALVALAAALLHALWNIIVRGGGNKAL